MELASDEVFRMQFHRMREAMFVRVLHDKQDYGTRINMYEDPPAPVPCVCRCGTQPSHTQATCETPSSLASRTHPGVPTCLETQRRKMCALWHHACRTAPILVLTECCAASKPVHRTDALTTAGL
jgi:hypothetical protein